MSFQKNKYSFPSKDDFSSFYYYKSHINRKIESNKEKNPSPKKEIKLRNRSTFNKKVPNENFSLSHTLLCLSICSKKCIMEHNKYRKLPSAIDGLNCDQIDEYLFASQRLSNKVIKDYDLINKLKELNIGLIVNCEVKGEHPLCGDPYYEGLDPCGFSYSTPLLEKNGIEVLLCGWNDLLTPNSFQHLIKIIKKMYYYINTLKKKIIVHCHAGFGRTAIVLASYYIFTQKVGAAKARKLIRKGERKYCLGSHIQFNFVKEFAQFLEIIRMNFMEKNKKDLTIFKINEKMLDIGEYKFKYFIEKKYVEYVPIFLLYIFERIIQIKNENNDGESKIYNYILNDDINTKEENKKVKKLIQEINNHNFDEIKKCDDLKILGYLLLKWLNHSINFVINPNILSNIDIKNYSSNLDESTKTIIDCISKFISLILDNKNENNELLKDFLIRFSPLLFGYSSEDIKNNKEKNNVVDKLNQLILYILKNNHN